MVEYYVRRKGMTVAEAGIRLSPSLAQTPEAAQARLGDSGRGWAANVLMGVPHALCGRLSGRPARPKPPGPNSRNQGLI